MADQKEFKLLPTGGDTFSEIFTKINIMSIRLHI